MIVVGRRCDQVKDVEFCINHGSSTEDREGMVLKLKSEIDVSSAYVYVAAGSH